MAKREVLDEEPFDFEITEDEEVVDLSLSEDDEEEDEEELEEEKPSGKKKAGALTDEDLDRFEKERRELTDRATSAELAAKEAADIAAAAVDRLEKAGAGDAKKKFAEQRAALSKSIADKRKALKQAFEEGDGDKHAELTEELADLKGQERILTIAEEQYEQQAKQPRRPQPAKPHPKAEAWLKRNQWFTTNEEARMAAVFHGNMLERQGVSPASDEYYEKIDAHMRKRYSELFDEEEPAKKRPAPPVKGVERETSGAQRRSERNRVKLTPLQVQMAKRWGIPVKEYAKEVLKQRKREEASQ